ncbi:type II secretion system F family protein [Candidatus Nanohalococcus occultus]|uniref:Pilus assembly protein TadC n=1 Tax=Candidatus Nanohalococcus occultus TaxID=2978047 RepID=A0ABY8CFM9_9ARCH|nr:Pilus assembly protein TadC [Candidatus Nanohaloarchaeota archaeon SVXNc]
MNEDEKDKLKGIVNNLNRDIELPPYDNDTQRGYSRDYKKYKKEEVQEQGLSRYERLCQKAGSLFNIRAGESSMKRLGPPLRLLGWEVSPGMVLSASTLVGFITFMMWMVLIGLNFLTGTTVSTPDGTTVQYLLPMEMLFLLIIFPISATAYTYLKPVYDAKEKMITSSGEMILSILYMVVYMRSSPNIEGAVRFAALNLNGEIASDLKRVLWNVEVGNYSRVSKSLEEYTKVWKDYNDDYLQSLQMLEAAMRESNTERRKDMLQDSIDNILEGTQEKMKHYAQGLKTPVMILNALGALLPVLGLIMLPLVSIFMGGVITPVHLVMLFNIMLPTGLWWFMQRLLTSRPPTTSTQPVDDDYLPERGKTGFTIAGQKIRIPSWVVGVVIFGLLSVYGLLGYLQFPHMYPFTAEEVSSVPGLYGSVSNPDSLMMLLRSLSITSGLGLGIGATMYLGNRNRKEAIEKLQKIERQFPDVLFQLGNKVSGGTPVEVALQKAAEDSKDMEISGLFQKASENVTRMGMTFEDALFDSTHGAIREYPSQTIETVMKAITQSSQKGTQMAAVTMMTISRYLQNIHRTQETLNDLLEETTTTLVMLSYILAPIVSAIAVGMSQTIMTAMFKISQSFTDLESNQAPSAGFGFAQDIGGAIPPEALQLVVGVYLIQLLYILGTFSTKITKGEEPTYRALTIGKMLISGVIIYSLVMITISWLFGGVVSSVATG